MDMSTKVYELAVDDDLLAHRAHLPETIECQRCGYVRAEADVPVLVTATV